MGEHHVSLQIDENNLVTKVGHDMGGSYEYTEMVDGESYDKCVLCNKVTHYKTSTHIDMRFGYVEGVGQMCKDCFEAGSSSSREMISIPKNWVKRYSNDMELGAAVRKFYYDNY